MTKNVISVGIGLHATTKEPQIQFSVGDLQRVSEELLENAGVLHPGAPISVLSERAIEMAEEDFLAALDQAPRIRHFKALHRIMRAQKRREELAAGWLFPQIREAVIRLPQKVDIGGRGKGRADLVYEDLKRRLRLLTKKSRDHFKDNAEVAAIKVLMELWPPRSRGRGGPTLSMLDTSKAREAGLIE